MPKLFGLTLGHSTKLGEIFDWYDRIGRRLRLTVPKPDRPQSGGGSLSHWGKLDAELSSTASSTGVTLSVWKGEPLSDSGQDILNVLPPPTLNTGAFESGSWALATRIDGRWYAEYTGIVETVLTDFRVNGVTLQVKTRDIVVAAASTESAWTTRHTGTACT